MISRKLILLLMVCAAAGSVAFLSRVTATNRLIAEHSPTLPSIIVVGDSTANNNANGGLGWATPFADYFDATKVNVLNRARGGRSSRTFQAEGLWDQALAEIKAGDYVLIQFGHNDGGPLDTDRARGSLPGTSEMTKEITTPDGKKEVVHTYGWYMRKYVADTKAKGAIPIVLSLTVRNIWKDGKVERGSGQFGQWSAEIANAQKVTFVDMTTIIANKYEELSEEKVKALFATDHTHTSPAGADLNASLTVAGLKVLKDSPFNKYLSAKGNSVAAYTGGPGRQPRPLAVPANPKLPTLFLIGDSTVRNGQGDGSNGQWGWGEPIVSFFDATKINVVNRAYGGRSSRTYLTIGDWDKVMEMLKPGDFVIMQFGHNDGAALNDDSRARGTIKGTGEESEEIDNILTKKHEVVHSFGWYLRKFTSDTRAKGATPIICSLIPRKIWKDGKIARNSADYGKWAADVAKSEKTMFIDLNELIAQKYDALGPEKVEAMFADEHTHTSLVGAELNAATVVEGLKALKENPLGAYLSEKGKNGSKTSVEPSSKPDGNSNLKFDFGSATIKPGHKQVLANTTYNKEIGYGFEPGAVVSCATTGCSSDKPFFFSAALPEGNYSVAVTFGDLKTPSVTTVKAELRRLMVEKIETSPGKFETRTFNVNLRTPQIAGGGEVKLKDREKTTEIWDWDEKLTLEFNNSHPSVSSIEITRVDDIPTIYILGDSTVCDQPLEPYNSWGQMLTRFFKSGIAIANNAESGESLKSSLGARRLDKVMSVIKPGDYLFIQFGHNDEKEKGEGIGAFTTYKSDLKRFVAEAKKHGAFPVVITPVQRLTFDAQGKITNSHGDYPEAVRQVAAEEKVPLIDLHKMSTLFYEAMGPEKSKLAFKEGDGTHHNNYGSYELAKCIVEGIKANNLGIVKYLIGDTRAFDPSHPDSLETFKIPASPIVTEIKPLGN